jgi:hypothetical protein
MVVRSIDLLGYAAAVQWRSIEEEQKCRLLGIHALAVRSTARDRSTGEA